MKELKKEKFGSGIPVFQHDKAQHHAMSGFNLVTTGLAADSFVPAGTVLGYDEAARTATILKTAKVVEAVAADGVAIKVAKGHLLAVGDNVFKEEGGAAYGISAINTSDPAFDTLTVETTLGALAEGDILVQSAAEGATAGAFAVTPKGLLYSRTKVDDIPLVDVVIRGTVYARRIPPVSDEIQSALSNIFFSQSY